MCGNDMASTGGIVGGDTLFVAVCVLRDEGIPHCLPCRYTFYDGPPFATGLPHYGHILAGTIKVRVWGEGVWGEGECEGV